MEFHIALIFYILGGVTFVPIVLCALVLLLYIRSSFIQWNRIEDSVPALDNTCYKDSVNNSYGTWITLSETYEEELLDDESKVPSISSDETFSKHKTAYSSLFKLVNGTVKASNPDLASEKRTSMSADIPSGRVTVFAVVREFISLLRCNRE
ncbi:hypothetical protein TRVA0_001S07602 [Trichomonascus vanleenenianus]|uniref:uncharacterized protein n=1 Tax=Trichomonascus vanleenenianus TaxID=2268995 RepID=UPI003EC96320